MSELLQTRSSDLTLVDTVPKDIVTGFQLTPGNWEVQAHASFKEATSLVGSYIQAIELSKYQTSITIDGADFASVVIQDITYTAAAAGAVGNDITIAYVGGGTAGSETVDVTDSAIEITIEDGVSTATQVKAAFDGESAATDLASATITGTAGDPQDVVTATNLENGEDDAVDIDANTITVQGHEYDTAVKGQLTTTGNLPTGLSLATDYYIIKVDANTIKLATSESNALAGTAVDITALGDGVHTFTREFGSFGSIESFSTAAKPIASYGESPLYIPPFNLHVAATHWVYLIGKFGIETSGAATITKGLLRAK